MAMRTTFWTAALVCCGLFMSGATQAQDQPDPAQSAIEQMRDASPRDREQYAEETIREIEASVRRVSRALSDAEKEDDQVLIACLSTKLPGLRALQEATQAAAGAMSAEDSESDNVRAEHEFRKIIVARSMANAQAAEADGCAGGGSENEGTTIIEVTGDDLGDPTETDIIVEIESDDVGVDPPETTPFE